MKDFFWIYLLGGVIFLVISIFFAIQYKTSRSKYDLLPLIVNVILFIITIVGYFLPTGLIDIGHTGRILLIIFLSLIIVISMFWWEIKWLFSKRIKK